MVRRACLRVLAGVAAVALPLAGIAPAGAVEAEEQQPAQRTVLTYDASRAAEFADEVEAGMEIWNAELDNVRLEPAGAGERANIVVIADNGWPRAQLGPVRPGGQVVWYFGRQAVNLGYDEVRIAAHETGHSLGLPDVKPGPCSSLMSGSSGGVGCTNAVPNARERQRADANYGLGAAGLVRADGRMVVDAPDERALVGVR